VGFIIYLMIFCSWLIADFYRSFRSSFSSYGKIFSLILLTLILIYLPSLITRENYFANRTLFALNMAVFFLVATTLLVMIKKRRTSLVVGVLSTFFVVNAWFNFNKQFLIPVRNEYMQVKAYIDNNYSPAINEVYFIRPKEDFFSRTYNITRSWDEFGVPSTFFKWVPEFFVKQIIFEKTGSRMIAEKLTIRDWLGKEEFLSSNLPLKKEVLLIDVEEIISARRR
jgi:hypothetical protein